MSTQIAKTIPVKSALANSCRAGGFFGSSLMTSFSPIAQRFHPALKRAGCQKTYNDQGKHCEGEQKPLGHAFAHAVILAAADRGKGA